MKKSKRTWLLLAGVAALSATLLVPTVLSACSSTPENENPGDGNKPGDGEGNGDGNNGGDNGGNGNTDQEQPKPNKLAEELKKLNEPNNFSARKIIYTNYFDAVNAKDSSQSRLAQLNPPAITKPSVTPLTEITKKPDFFDDLISMINNGLDVVDSSPENNQISKDELTQIITSLVNEKENMKVQGNIPNTSANPTPGSIWSPSAFEFNDVSTATWTYVSQDNNTVYELYLTGNVDFIFESTADSVSVKVSNKPGSDKTRSRLVVTKKGAAVTKRTNGGKSSTPATGESKSYNFKSDLEFALPKALFGDFDKYVDAFNTNTSKLKDYIKEATDKYKNLTNDANATKSFASAATLWNQFVSQSEEQILDAMISDLNTKRSKSKIFEWIKDNVSEATSSNKTTDTTLVGQLQKDLEAAKSINVDLDTLLIKGKNADNNGLNNYTNEEPDYTLIISFDVEKTVQSGQKEKTGKQTTEPTLDEKWYILNLKATEFKFENTINNDFFGYQDNSFITSPKLKLDAKSSFASYKLISAGDQLNGNDLATVQKIKGVSLKQQDTLVDVSSLYDINGTGFTKFLTDLVINRQSEDTKLTDKLLDVNSNKQANTITKLKQYLKTDAAAVKSRLLEPNVLADLILDNIDLNNLMFKSEKFGHAQSTDNFPQILNPTVGNLKGWRQILNDWVKGGSGSSVEAKPEVLIKGSSNYNNSRAISNTFANAADIVIRAKTTSSSDIPTKPLILNSTNNDYRFRSIYIFLGNGSGAESLVSGSNDETKSASLSVDLTNTKAAINQNDWQGILNQINSNNNMCVIFEKAKFDSTQNTNTPPIYGFYMGQRKVMTSTGRSGATQSKFSISLDSLLGDGSKFLQTLLG